MTGFVGGFVTAFVFEVSAEARELQRPSFSPLFFRNELMLAAIFNVMVVAGFYLYGIKRRDTIFMEPFLITKGTSLILDLFNLGLSVLARAFQYKTMTLFIELIAFAFDSYMFTILHSFYEEVRNSRISAYDADEDARWMWKNVRDNIKNTCKNK